MFQEDNAGFADLTRTEYGLTRLYDKLKTRLRRALFFCQVFFNFFLFYVIILA